jgi:hypothetical protein
MQRIDLNDLLQRAVSASNGDLVTRHTGQRVRAAIEQVLAAERDGHVAGLDFGTVRCLDLSCADEIVGRLLREHGEAQFVLLNVTAAQRDAIEFVLERHRLAVVVQDAGGALDVVGTLPAPARDVFGALAAGGALAPDEVARRLGLSGDEVRAALDALRERHLIQDAAGAYRAAAVA